MDVNETVELIRGLHRNRRYAMKLQQKIDRALESFVRRNATEWSPDLDDKERDKINAQVKKIIANARTNEGDSEIIAIVQATDESRKPADAMRAKAEKQMEQLAVDLPVYQWVQQVPGAGALGLATIVAEAGPLDRYPNPAKLWTRLGFAPFDGHAGSTWKRESWRPRKLTSDEWIDHPFSGERYALMHQIALWLVNKQWLSAAKAGGDEGRPNGPYGNIYATRRAATARAHPDWTKQHGRMDGLRVAMKAFLLDLWCVWHGRATKHFRADQDVHDAQDADVGSKKAAGQLALEAQSRNARRTSSKRARSTPRI
jgi:hypothetical protein